MELIRLLLKFSVGIVLCINGLLMIYGVDLSVLLSLKSEDGRYGVEVVDYKAGLPENPHPKYIDDFMEGRTMLNPEYIGYEQA